MIGADSSFNWACKIHICHINEKTESRHGLRYISEPCWTYIVDIIFDNIHVLGFASLSQFQYDEVAYRHALI